MFTGSDGDVSEPFWRGQSELVIPFCWGTIDTVESVSPYKTREKSGFRTRTSAQIRVHVVTAPDVIIGARHVCGPRRREPWRRFFDGYSPGADCGGQKLVHRPAVSVRSRSASRPCTNVRCWRILLKNSE